MQNLCTLIPCISQFQLSSILDYHTDEICMLTNEIFNKANCFSIVFYAGVINLAARVRISEIDNNIFKELYEGKHGGKIPILFVKFMSFNKVGVEISFWTKCIEGL